MVIRKGYKQTELGIIPEEWAIKRIREITKVSVGLVINPSTYFDKNGTVPMITGKNVTEKGIVLNDVDFISEKSNKFLETTRIWSGDLVTMRVGYPGRTSVVKKEHDGINCASVIITRKNKKFVSEFLSYLASSNLISKQIIANQVGGAQKVVNIGSWKEFFIVFPPMPEQEIIVQYLSTIDQLIYSLESLIQKKKNIKQGTMQELLTEKRRLEGFSGKWEIKSLGDCLIENPKYGINAPAVKFSPDLITYIRITDISVDGYFIHGDKTSVIHPDVKNFILKEGDIVFARTGASTGKTYLYNSKDGQLAFAGFLILIKTNPNILLPEFLKIFTETQNFWNWVKKTSTRSGQEGINANEIKQLTLSIPAINEQCKIAKIIFDMNNEIKQLGKQLEKYTNLKQAMMQKLLTGEIRLV